MSALINLQTPKLYSLFLSSRSPYKSSQPQFQYLPLSFLRKTSISFTPLRSLYEEEEPIIGDRLVFEEGVFNDPYINRKHSDKPRRRRDVTRQKRSTIEVERESLVPGKWTEVLREINITKKEEPKPKLKFERRVERKLLGLRPIGEDGRDSVGVEDYSKLVEEKLKQLKPIVLDNPVFPEAEEEELSGDEEECSTSNSRVTPNNPRSAVNGRNLDDIRKFFNSENYDPSAANKSEGRLKLFSKPKEEKLLMNKVPDLAVATHSRWIHPRTPTPTPGLKSSRGDSSHVELGRYRGYSDYDYQRSPRHSTYQGGRDYSLSHSPYRGRSRIDQSRSYSPGGYSDYDYRSSPSYSPRHSPNGGRSRRDRSRSYSPNRSLERNYTRGR